MTGPPNAQIGNGHNTARANVRNGLELDGRFGWKADIRRVV